MSTTRPVLVPAGRVLGSADQLLKVHFGRLRLGFGQSFAQLQPIAQSAHTARIEGKLRDASFAGFCNLDERRNLWIALPYRIGWNRPLPSGKWASIILRMVIPSGAVVSVPFRRLRILKKQQILRTQKSLIRLTSWREPETVFLHLSPKPF